MFLNTTVASLDRSRPFSAPFALCTQEPLETWKIHCPRPPNQWSREWTTHPPSLKGPDGAARRAEVQLQGLPHYPHHADRQGGAADADLSLHHGLEEWSAGERSVRETCLEVMLLTGSLG